MTAIRTHTPEQREAHRQRERDRRAKIKQVDAACEVAGIRERYADLTKEQRERAISIDPSFRAEVIRDWILDGREPADRHRAVETPVEPNPARSFCRADTRGAPRRLGLTSKESREVQQPRVQSESSNQTPGPRPRAGSVVALSIAVLENVGRPMHIKAITDAILAMKDHPLTSKTPVASVTARALYNDRDGGALQKVAPSIFALRDWADDIKAQEPVIPDGLRRRRAEQTA